MRKPSWVLLIGTIFFLLAGPLTRGQDEDNGPPNPQDLLSGGSTLPDTTALSPGPSSPSGTKRPPRVGPNLQVNAPQQAFPNGLLGRSETSIAATDDGELLLVGFNDAQGFCGPPFGVACTPERPPGLSGFAFSSDGGGTFTDGGAPDPAVFNNVFTRGDPWMDRGGFDNLTFYYANLAVDATSGASLGVSVHRGHFNNGFAFEDVHTFNSSNPNDVYDKEAIAVTKGGSGAAYVTLTNFKQLTGCPAGTTGLGEITAWRTTDGGNTWLGPVVAGPDLSDPGSCGATGVLQQSSVPAIGPSGELYVVWSQGPTFTLTGVTTDAKIVVARSLDGGVTFDPPVTVANINSMRQNAPVGYNRDRLNDHPRITVVTGTPNTGRVYVVFYSALAPVAPAPSSSCPSPPFPPGALCRAQNLTSSQVYVSHSDDKGLTWTTPVPVATAPPSTGVKRWWPVVTVEPGGNLDVVYYESQETTVGSNPFCTVSVGGGLRRRGTANSLVDTFWAQSLDGGATFPTLLKVTTATSNWCTVASNVRPNFGDYIGTAPGGNHIFATWADGRNGVPDTFYSTLQGAGKSK
jgi:hypothetical protein